MPCFLDFSCPLKSCIAAFTFEEGLTSSSLFWLTLGEKYFLSHMLGILRLFKELFNGYICSLCFATTWEGILRLYAFFQSCKASQVPDSFLFAGCSAECSGMCFVPFLWSQFGFLGMRTSHLKLLHSLPLGHTQGAGQWVAGVQNVGGAIRWGGSAGKSSPVVSGYIRVLPDVVCKVLNRIFVPWWIEPWLLCSKLSSIPSVMKINLRILDVVRKKRAFWSETHTWGSQMLTHTLFPSVEKWQAEWVSLGTERCHFVEGVTQIIESVPLTHFNAPTVGSFCSNGVLKHH